VTINPNKDQLQPIHPLLSIDLKAGLNTVRLQALERVPIN
jgi:hypothetical protein